MDRNRLYKEQYDLEWSHRSHLLSMTNFCMVAATVIGTALVAAAQSFNYASGYSALFFVPLLLASAIALVRALHHIGKSLIGRNYKYLPPPEELESHYTNLVAWALPSSSGLNPDAEFEQDLHRLIAAAASVNFKTNSEKAAFVQRALASIRWSLMLLAFAALPYLMGNTVDEQAIISFFTDNSTREVFHE